MKNIFLALIIVFMSVGMISIAYAEDGNVKIVSFAGDVSIMPAGGNQKADCEAGKILNPGDAIETGKRSEIIIAYDTNVKNVVKIYEKSNVVLMPSKDDKIELLDGEIFAMLKGMKPGEVFRVRTPSATCGARGTGWKTKANKKETDVQVGDGSIDVQGVNKDGSPKGKKKNVGAGFGNKTKKGQEPGDKKKLSDEQMNKLKKEMQSLQGFGKGGAGKGGIPPKARSTQKRSDKMERKFEKMQETKEEVKDRKLMDEKRREKDDDHKPYKPPRKEIRGPVESIR